MPGLLGLEEENLAWKGSVQVRGLPAVGEHPDKEVTASCPAGVGVGGNGMDWGLAPAFPPKHTESGRTGAACKTQC